VSHGSVRRRLAGFAAILSLLVIVALFVAHSAPVRRYAFSHITAILAQRQIGLELDGFSYNLLNASIDLRNVRVRSERLPDAPTFASIGRARIDMSLVDLLRGRYVIQSGAIEGVRVHYFVDEQGRDNLPTPPRDPNQPAGPIDYLVANLSLSDARVRYESRPQQVDADLPIPAVVVQGNRLTDRHRVRLTGANGYVRVDARTIRLDQVAMEAELGDDDLQFDRLNAESQGSSVELEDLTYDLTTKRAALGSLRASGPWGRVTGTGSVSPDPSERSRLQADIVGVDAGWLSQSLGLPYTVATRIDGSIRAEWPGQDYLRISGEADARLTATASQTTRATLPVGGRVTVRGEDGRIDVRLVQVDAAGAQLAGRLTVSEDRRLSGERTGRLADVGRTVSSLEAFMGRRRGSLLPTPVTGPLGLDARISGTMEAPSATSVVNAPALRVGMAEGISLNADLEYAATALTVRRADITWEQARAHVDGRVGLTADRRLDLNLTADELGVPWLLRVANQDGSRAAGVVSARGTIRGTSSRPEARVAVQGTNLVAYEEPIGTLSADVELAGREIQVSRLVIDKPQPDEAGRIAATGRYHLDQRTYTVDLKSNGLRLLGLQLPSGERIRGSVQITGGGSGSVNAPAGNIDVTLDALEIDRPSGDFVETVPVGRVVVTATAEDEAATITATAERFNLQADAVVALARPWPATVSVRAENLDLTTLPLGPLVRARGDAPPSLTGQLRATITASGNLVEPEAGEVSAAIQSMTGSVNGRPFAVKPSALRYENEQVAIETLEIEASGSVLMISGALPLTDSAREGELAVDLRGNLATLSHYLPQDFNVAADGTIALTGTLTGSLRTLDPNLVLTIQNGAILSPDLQSGLSDIELRARVTDGVAHVEQLSGYWGAGTLDVSGQVPLAVLPPLPVEVPRADGPSTLRATLQGLHPAAIPGAPAALGGIVTLHADLSAPGADLAALDGTITFQELTLTFRGLELAQQDTSTITVAAGAATIERFALTGSAGTIVATGSVGPGGARAINVDVDGVLDAGAVALLTDRVRAEGETTLKIQARGTVEDPDLDGTLTVRRVSVVSDEPNIAARNIDADLALDGTSIVLTSLTGDVNGGTLRGSGSVTLGNGGISDIDLRIATTDFAYDAPLDLRSLSDSEIRIAREGEDFVVSGTVTISEGGLTGDINFDTGLLAAMTARRRLDLTEERNAFLERVRFDVDINTVTPLLVDNNIAQTEVEARLRLVGTPYEPGLTGQLTMLEGGEIRLNARRYEVERGVIAFVDDRRIFPSFDLLLHTSAGNYDINVGVTGTPGDTEAILTSTPALPEPDIMALLATGRTVDDMRGEEFEVAQEQVLSYLTGRVGSTLGRGLEQATGLSEVRIEPALIASETEPSARLTLGQDLTDELKLVYSTNLTDSNDQIWILAYDVTRRFQTRGVRQSDATFRVDFSHDVRFGGQAPPRRQPRVRPTVASVAVVSEETGEGDEDVREEFDVTVGDPYDFFALHSEVQEVEEALRAQGLLQSRIRLERRVEGDQAHLTLRVRRGPVVDMQFAGMIPPDAVQDDVRTQWHRGVFDTQRADDGIEAIREWLMTSGYLQPKVECTLDETGPDRRRVTFQVEAGPHYDRVLLAFDGAAAVDPAELDAIVDQQDLERQLFTDPLVVTELLERYYRDQGYLVAEIDEPRIQYAGSEARVSLAVREGPQFTVRRVVTSGNTAVGTDALLSQLPVAADGPFLPAAAERALETIRTVYWPLGYNDLRSNYSLVVDRLNGYVDVTFTIAEGPQSVVSDIVVRGNERISEELVRRQIELTPAQPLDLGALAASRRNLYDTGAFSVVQIDRGDRGGGPGEEASGGNGKPAEGLEPAEAGNSQSTEQKAVRLNVIVREVQPLQLRYGASYDTERGAGGIFDVSRHNWLGGARVVGLQARYDRQLRDGRVYFHQPLLRRLPVETTGTVYFREDRSPPTELTRAFTASRKGASVQQEIRLRDAYVWSWGYRYERARTLEPVAGVIVGDAQTVSPLTSTITRDTRDEALDAAKGSFLSQAIAFSPGWLGSDVPYVRYYGQYFHYFPLQPPKRKPYTNEILRPRLVFATGVRLGLARGIGSEVPRTERFFAGGSVTLRGFAHNAVGPIGPDHIPTGGNALIVINNELRAPLVSIVDGVVFADIGNVFPSINDFSLTTLRQSVGVGIRLRTPWFLIRGDYGVVLDPRPGERRNRAYVSIGQAF
jgi:outer membrane protein assembly factor BamA/autotransporter translocation and assembly factor TamB